MSESPDFAAYSKQYKPSVLKGIFRSLLKPRLFEERMLLLLRQGKLSKWFASIGQEAIGVGAALAIDPQEYILPIHRSTGIFLTRGVPIDRLMAQFIGKAEGFTNGRDRSFYFGTPEYLTIGGISHLGSQIPVADGIALAHRLREEKKVCLVLTGEGGSSQGDFHEALNVAAVWKLPVIFVIENNGYALSTPVEQQYACEKLADRALGYGIEGRQIDGNNVLEVHSTISELANEIRSAAKPVLLECMTFRMRGHEEASGTKYVPQEKFDYWAKRDPVDSFESYLIDQEIYSKQDTEAIRDEVRLEIEQGIELAYSFDELQSDEQAELAAVYAPAAKPIEANGEAKERRYIDAIKDALELAMDKHDAMVLMGQDVADYGGAFKASEGFLKKYGAERVRNTPLCESAILGMSVGLSICGVKSIIEMQFADFVTCGFNQLVNNVAKLHYRWGQNVDTVVRLPTGGGMRAGPFHSASTESLFAHVPGLKIVYPSSAYDAKGLLLAAIEDPNPVLFFEHKMLYRRISEEVPQGYFSEEIGKAKILSEGDDLTILTYGLGVHWAKEMLKEKPNLSATLVDLRSLAPLDYQTISESVERTGRVLVFHEDTLTAGIGAEIAAYVAENCFSSLDAPVLRCASLDTAVPFVASLEDQFMANSRLERKLAQLLSY